MTDPPLRPPRLVHLSGDEEFSFGASVVDFWTWALGDLRMNTIRGFLAEFFVAQAVGSEAPHRVEWAPFDVESAEGIRLEVKATGHLQSWTQSKRSTPEYTFSTAYATSMWDEALGQNVAVDPMNRVDAWVFALQTCQDHTAYQPLDLEQWKFRVVPHRQLIASGQKSARLSFFDRLGVEPVGFDRLADAVRAAHAENGRLAVEGPRPPEATSDLPRG